MLNIHYKDYGMSGLLASIAENQNKGLEMTRMLEEVEADQICDQCLGEGTVEVDYGGGDVRTRKCECKLE